MLQEVSQYAPVKLKKMEECFAKLKADIKDINARMELVECIKEFTKIDDVTLLLDNTKNAGIYPIYKYDHAIKFSKIVQSLIDRREYNKPISPQKLMSLETVQEPATAIVRVYIYMGKPFINMLTPEELVAVFLHEIGHVFAITTRIPFEALSFLKGLFQSLVFTKTVLYVTAIVTHFYFLYTLIALGLIYGITFHMRLGESIADKYAARYGYGDELVKVLEKCGKPKKTKNTFFGKVKSFMIALASVARLIVDPYEHPSDRKRIRDLEKKIFNEYRQLYPEYKDMINQIEYDYRQENTKEKEVVAV